MSEAVFRIGTSTVAILLLVAATLLIIAALSSAMATA